MSFLAFTEGDATSTFHAHLERVLREVRSLEVERILNSSIAELEIHYIEKASINPLVMHEQDRYMEEPRGVMIDVSHDRRRAIFPGERAEVPGTRFTVRVPYEGDDLLWKLRPSRFTYNSKHIDVKNGEVILTYSFPDDVAEQQKGLKDGIDSDIAFLEKMAGNLKRDVDEHNQKAKSQIANALKDRRQRALSVSSAIEELDIPMRRKDTPAAYVAPVHRRSRPVSSRPAQSKSKYSPEPFLEEAEYAYILKVLSSMSVVIERNPESFRGLDEEAIRDHFLLSLNGHYEGSATGETFNAAGKTDILIREKDRNIFIAECKFWRGAKSFDSAVTQLLSYLTWRDCKAALLIFNRNKDSASVEQRMDETMRERGEFRKVKESGENRGAAYILIKNDEPGREIIVTTQIYDVSSE